MTLLSNSAILRHLNETGAIVISPFNPAALNSVSYDLTLGDTIARYRSEELLYLDCENPADAFEIESARTTLRPVCKTCGRCRIVGSGLTGRCHNCYEPLTETCRGFFLDPLERVLAHSREIAGGRQVTVKECSCRFYRNGSPCGFPNTPVPVGTPGAKTYAVTTQLHATSTAARIGLQVCGCAGFGDVGYLDRWTFELQNLSPRPLFIPVGAVIAQVSFYEVEPILDASGYELKGNYAQVAQTPEEIHAQWTPQRMLPKRLKVRP